MLARLFFLISLFHPFIILSHIRPKFPVFFTLQVLCKWLPPALTAQAHHACTNLIVSYNIQTYPDPQINTSTYNQQPRESLPYQVPAEA